MSQNRHTKDDALAARLFSAAQHTLVAVFGLLPVFFIPLPAAPFGYSKVLFVLVGVCLALILYGAAVLRSGTFRASFSWSPVLLWLVAFVAVVSGLLSGDFRDTFIGDAFSGQSALFVALLALAASAWMLVGAGRGAVMRLFLALSASTLILALFHVARLVLGADALTLGVFGGDATLSPLGGWNDLAIFFGLAIILSLVALEQLALTRIGQALFVGVVLAAILMLAVVNFFAVWVVLALVSLAILVYALTKGRFSGERNDEKSTSVTSVGVSLLVLIASVVFIVGGSAAGTLVSSVSSISYLEVRPSVGATAEIARSVYQESALFGTGPNRFADAWRLHKDPEINQSIFWNTDFLAGFGYIPTFFVTMGLIGTGVWLLFLITFFFSGMRMLLRPETFDRTWYFIGTVSFVGGLYLWAMAVVYVPGPVLLLLAALCTGLAAAASAALGRGHVYELGGTGGKRTGFALVAVFLVLVVGSVSALYAASRDYAGVYTFNRSLVHLAEGASIEEIEAQTVAAYALSQNDAYARHLAEYQIMRMEQLLTVPEPTDADRETFTAALNTGINAAQVAVATDGTNPHNWRTLGRIYAALVPAGIEGAHERAREAVDRATSYDPQNPTHALSRAQIAYAAGDETAARAQVEEALSLKANYTDAIFFLSQIDIAAGNTAAAIESVRAVTVLESQNPVRFFQLGVLQLSTNAYAEAATSLERAVGIDGGYANARYYLALAYDALGREDEARDQLAIVLRTNPDNELVLAQLGKLERGEALLDVNPGTVEERPDATAADGTVTTSVPPDTPLVSPVNTPADSVE